MSENPFEERTYIVLKTIDETSYWIEASEEDRLSARFSEFIRRGGPDDILELAYPGRVEVLNIPLSQIKLWWVSSPEGRKAVYMNNAASTAENKRFAEEAKTLFGWSED